MLNSLNLPVKTIIRSQGNIQTVPYGSKESARKAFRSSYRKIRRAKMPLERTACRWQGYYCCDSGEDEPEVFTAAAFVLTERRIYAAYELLSEINLSVIEIGKHSSYEINESNRDKLTSFALLCSGQVMYCLYDKNEALTRRLEQEMRRIGIPTLMESLRNIFERLSVK